MCRNNSNVPFFSLLISGELQFNYTNNSSVSLTEPPLQAKPARAYQLIALANRDRKF